MDATATSPQSYVRYENDIDEKRKKLAKEFASECTNKETVAKRIRFGFKSVQNSTRSSQVNYLPYETEIPLYQPAKSPMAESIVVKPLLTANSRRP